jgi:hypothetical protein
MRNVMVHVNAPFDTIQVYNTERGAKIGLAAANRNAGYVAYKLVTHEERKAADTMVTVYNLMSGKPVQIRRSDRGGICDPSMELYWSA